MKNSSDTKRDRNRDLPACSAVPQPSASPRTPQPVYVVWDCQISRQWTHEGGSVVSPKIQPPLPSKKYSWYSFLLEDESTPWP